MALLEELTPGVLVKGLLPGGIVTLISVKQHGSIGAELIYKDASGHLGEAHKMSATLVQPALPMTLPNCCKKELSPYDLP